ncbi:MAG: hypothetical protein KatS3mg008_1239 [Acidimicrobiales bacterium]|nr:MAG: hypothetical protein KatS3mg008_1239 [Acidimicrobiales bacterium]
MGRLTGVTKILVVTDSDSLASELELQLAGPHTEVRRFADGRAALVAVALDAPDVVICDMQVSNMGGIAICMDLKLEAGAGRLPEGTGPAATGSAARRLSGPACTRRCMAGKAVPRP